MSSVPAENPASMKFCGQCAAPLAAACPSCGAINPPENKFCGQCAAPLSQDRRVAVPLARRPTPPSTSPRRSSPPRPPSRASASRSPSSSPTSRARWSCSPTAIPRRRASSSTPCSSAMMEAVHRYEGTVNQVMGDGIMALFGAPLAHEDHAVRACYAALRMQDAVRRYSDELRRAQGVEVQIRVGAQLRRGRGALDRQRSPHGLHRRRPDHAPGGAHGAARGARQHPAHRRDAAAGRGLRPGHPARPGAGQGARRAGRGVRAGGGRRRPHPPRGRGAAGAHALRRPRRGAGAAPRRPRPGRAWGTARWSPWSGSRAWASRGSSGSSPTPTACTAG